MGSTHKGLDFRSLKLNPYSPKLNPAIHSVNETCTSGRWGLDPHLVLNCVTLQFLAVCSVTIVVNYHWPW